MPVEVSLKKIAKRGRVVDVTTLTVPHETSMTILDLKEKVITIMDADASHGAHDLHISHHGELDAKSGTTVLPNDNPVADDEKVDVIYQDLMSRLSVACANFSKTEAGKKADHAFAEAMRDAKSGASSSEPAVESEAVASSEQPVASSEQPPSDGLTKVKIQCWDFNNGYYDREVECFQITYLQGLPHVQTCYGVYQVSKHFTQTRNCLFLNQDEDEERVHSADDASLADEIETVDDEEPVAGEGYASPIRDGEHPMDYVRRALVMTAPNASQGIPEPEGEAEAQGWKVTVMHNQTEFEIGTTPKTKLTTFMGEVAKTVGVKSKKDIRLFMDENMVTELHQLNHHIKNIGITDGMTLHASIRGLLGGAVRAKAKAVQTKQAKQNKAMTKSTEKMHLLTEMKQATPDTVKELPVVADALGKVEGFVGSLGTMTASQAFASHAAWLRARNPIAFAEVVQYLKTSGSNNPSTKLSYIAPKMFDVQPLVDFYDQFEAVASAPKTALMAGFEKAIAENPSFTMSSLIGIFEATEAVAGASSASAVAPIAPSADAEM